MCFWAGVRGSIRTDDAPASPSQLRPAVMPRNTWGHAHRPPPRPLIGPRVQTSGRPSGDWLKHRTSDFIKQIFWKLGKGYNRGKNPWDNCGTAQLAVLLPPSFPALRSLLLLLSPARPSVARWRIYFGVSERVWFCEYWLFFLFFFFFFCFAADGAADDIRGDVMLRESWFPSVKGEDWKSRVETLSAVCQWWWGITVIISRKGYGWNTAVGNVEFQWTEEKKIAWK